MAFFIQKASGEREPFNIKKFEHSLRKARASEEDIQKLAAAIVKLPDLKTTHDIYRYAYDYLRRENSSAAIRYNLKSALYELGPEGFNFEKFVAEIFKAQQYNVLLDQEIAGACVQHEIDLVLTKESKTMVECKFHNVQGIKTDVKVALYIKARFDDVKPTAHFDQALLVTNTKFTAEAIAYAQCVQLNLLGWSYPEQKGIGELIDIYALHPITSLSSLTTRQKRDLINQGVLLCKEVHASHLSKLGMHSEQIDQILEQCTALTRTY